MEDFAVSKLSIGKRIISQRNENERNLCCEPFCAWGIETISQMPASLCLYEFQPSSSVHSKRTFKSTYLPSTKYCVDTDWDFLCFRSTRCSCSQLTLNKFSNKSCRWLNLNLGDLMLEATTLSTDPQSLHLFNIFKRC